MFERFRLIRRPDAEDTPMLPTDRMLKAAEELNAAWEENPDKSVKPWIEWDEKRVAICRTRFVRNEIEPTDMNGEHDV